MLESLDSDRKGWCVSYSMSPVSLDQLLTAESSLRNSLWCFTAAHDPTTSRCDVNSACEQRVICFETINQYISPIFLIFLPSCNNRPLQSRQHTLSCFCQPFQFHLHDLLIRRLSYFQRYHGNYPSAAAMTHPKANRKDSHITAMQQHIRIPHALLPSSNPHPRQPTKPPPQTKAATSPGIKRLDLQ